jgi:hypothetical protein
MLAIVLGTGLGHQHGAWPHLPGAPPAAHFPRAERRECDAMQGSRHHSMAAARSSGSWEKGPTITLSVRTCSSIGMIRFCQGLFGFGWPAAGGYQTDPGEESLRRQEVPALAGAGVRRPGSTGSG